MKYYVVDAFAEKVFEGNPAGVCVLERGLPEELMRKIAMENNLSETAFAVKEGDVYRLRWFTPGGEVDLCGHATLATAYVLANFVDAASDGFAFETLSGRLTVVRKGDLYEMDFPAYAPASTPVTDAMAEAIGFRPTEAWIARDLVCVLEDEQDVRAAMPDPTLDKRQQPPLVARNQVLPRVGVSRADPLNQQAVRVERGRHDYCSPSAT